MVMNQYENIQSRKMPFKMNWWTPDFCYFLFIFIFSFLSFVFFNICWFLGLPQHNIWFRTNWPSTVWWHEELDIKGLPPQSMVARHGRPLLAWAYRIKAHMMKKRVCFDRNLQLVHEASSDLEKRDQIRTCVIQTNRDKFKLTKVWNYQEWNRHTSRNSKSNTRIGHWLCDSKSSAVDP